MTPIKTLVALVFASVCITSCANSTSFVRVNNGGFEQNGKRLSFVGTNFWYGPILASEGEGGDRARLIAELDSLKGIGIKNLRILAGGDGPNGVNTRIEPTLQKAPGVYNDTLLLGLDYLLAEMAKRDMKAVLYLNNAWEWSGGFGCYLEWAGAGKALLPLVDGYWPYVEQMAQFCSNQKAQELYFNHIKFMVSRTNSVTGKAYKDDPTIFSWQLANEPRCFSSSATAKKQFVEWMSKAANIIKSIDPNHMVSSGSEGFMGSEQSYDLYEKVHSCPQIDYLTIHIWPYNWSWAPAPNPEQYVNAAIDSAKNYINKHCIIAKKLGKPIVIEEFGFPHDGMHHYGATIGRDRFYQSIADALVEAYKKGGALSGINFWGWSGYAPKQEDGTMWQKGMPYSADPAHEPQGINGVYADDVSTISILKNAASIINAR